MQIHYITPRYTTLITLHYATIATSTTLHYTTLHYNYSYTTLHYNTLHYTTLYHATVHNTSVHYTALNTPHHKYNCNCNYTNYTTLQLQLRTRTTLHYNYTYNYNCTAPHYIQRLWWGDHCNHCSHSRKHNSNHLSVHQWIRSAIRESQQPTLPIGFLFLKLPPPPCALLPVGTGHAHVTSISAERYVTLFVPACSLLLKLLDQYSRRKFRSQTSDNMDRWKSRGGKSQRREEKRREEERLSKRESLRRKKFQVPEKVGKSWNTVFFQWFVAPEGQKAGSPKRRVRSHLAKWGMENCTQLWRQELFEVKMCKTHQRRTAFGSWDVEKVHAIVAWSTFPSQNAQNTAKHDILRPCFGSLKKCTPLWREAHFQVKMYKTHHVQSTFASWDVGKKRSPLWREARFEVKMHKTHQRRTAFGSWDVQKVYALVARSTFPSQKCKTPTGTKHFWTLRCCFAWRAQGIARLVKVSKTWKFSSISQNDGRRGAFEEDLERCIFRGRRSTGDMFIRDVRRSGRWFPERGCILEHQIVRFAKMILRDRCSTLYDLASIFLAGAILQRHGLEKSQNALARGRQLCTQLSIIKGSLAELLRFWCCQLRKLRKSRRIASFSNLQKDR